MNKQLMQSCSAKYSIELSYTFQTTIILSLVLFYEIKANYHLMNIFCHRTKMLIVSGREVRINSLIVSKIVKLRPTRILRLSGILIDFKLLSKLIHAFAHLHEINVGKDSVIFGDIKEFKILPEITFNLKILDLRAVQNSKQKPFLADFVVKQLLSNNSLKNGLQEFRLDP
jgi:hypothetical protein